MNELIQQIMDNPFASLAIVGNLIIIESLLSVDNAAVLATMVMDLEPKQRNKALRYGIWGAYIFRGLAMIFAAFLIGFWWLKPLGGMYLLWLVADQFKEKIGYGEKGSLIFQILSLSGVLLLIQNDGTINEFAIWSLRGVAFLYIIYLIYSVIQLKKDEVDDGEINKSNNKIYNFFHHKIGVFWSTVILVEIMDMAFSIDNVFAAVAFSPNIILICTGVFIGILAMRFVAQAFVKLMVIYPFLETAAFIVISVLGIKLMLSFYEHFFPEDELSKFLGSHAADWATSIMTVSIFFIPILTCKFFNFPKKQLAK